MKAVIKNTIYGLLCLAGVVLAAPTQSTQFYKKAKKTEPVPGLKISTLSQAQSVAINLRSDPPPSLMDGSARFSCW